MWELPLRGEYNNKKKVLILVCVEVSVGVIRLNLCRLTARNVLILVCVEVSVGEYHNVFHHFLILHVLILVCVEVSVGENEKKGIKIMRIMS